MQKKRILIVDDERNIVWSLKQALEKNGYEVETFSDGQSLHKVLNTTPFDLIISDLDMKPVGGLELLETVRQAMPYAPFILMTAYGSLATAVKALRLRATDYLVKPIEIKQLLNSVEKALKGPSGMKESEVVGQQ